MYTPGDPDVQISADADCDHREVTHLGGDGGANSYYQCHACRGVLIGSTGPTDPGEEHSTRPTDRRRSGAPRDERRSAILWRILRNQGF